MSDGEGIKKPPPKKSLPPSPSPKGEGSDYRRGIS